MESFQDWHFMDNCYVLQTMESGAVEVGLGGMMVYTVQR